MSCVGVIIKVRPAVSEIDIAVVTLLSLYLVRDCHERRIDRLIDMQKENRIITVARLGSE